MLPAGKVHLETTLVLGDMLKNCLFVRRLFDCFAFSSVLYLSFVVFSPEIHWT